MTSKPTFDEQYGEIPRISAEEMMDLYGWDPDLQDAADEEGSLVRGSIGGIGSGQWPTLDECIPKGSFLALIDEAFRERTDIPRELAFWAAQHYLSAFLLQRGSSIKVNGHSTLPDFWTIALAPSGAGKTFTQNTIAKALAGQVMTFPDVSSAAAFVEAMHESNKGIWLRDEFAQFLKQLNVQPNLGQVKDYLLRTYDNNKIERITKADSIVINEPALTIFGTTPIATIKNYLTAEDLVDGFAQRFAFVFAERDGRELVPFYDLSEYLPKINDAWVKSTEGGLHNVYEIKGDGVALFSEAFQIITKQSALLGIDASFSRRLMWRAHKYALLYHVILGDTSDTITPLDMAYAVKLVALNLKDLRRLLDLYESPESDALVQKAAVFVRRKFNESGQKVTPRLLVAGVRGVGKSKVAREILENLVEQHPDLASMIEL